jgi:predicted nucleotidyltransferase
MLRELVLSHRDEINRLARQHGVKNIRMFGSVARGDAHFDSDIDLLVDDDGIRGLLAVAAFQLDLEELFGRKVDVLFSNCVKDSLKPYIFGGEQLWVC